MVRNKNRKRKPKVSGSYTPKSKQPALSKDFVSTETQTPSWTLSLIDLDGPFSWKNLTIEDFEQVVLKRLKHFEHTKWADILGKKNHPIPIEKLSSKAKKRLKALGYDQVESLISLYITGPKRVFGIRKGAVLQILWWDSTHSVCLSTKKNT